MGSPRVQVPGSWAALLPRELRGSLTWNTLHPGHFRVGTGQDQSRPLQKVGSQAMLTAVREDVLPCEAGQKPKIKPGGDSVGYHVGCPRASPALPV